MIMCMLLLSGLHDLASECLYVIGCVQNLKSRMLLSACDKGYLAVSWCTVFHLINVSLTKTVYHISSN